MSILDKLPGRQPYVRRTTDRELLVRRPYRKDAVLTGRDTRSEADVLADLAAETAASDPLTAAQRLFGGDQR